MQTPELANVNQTLQALTQCKQMVEALRSEFDLSSDITKPQQREELQRLEEALEMQIQSAAIAQKQKKAA